MKKLGAWKGILLPLALAVSACGKMAGEGQPMPPGTTQDAWTSDVGVSDTWWDTSGGEYTDGDPTWDAACDAAYDMGYDAAYDASTDPAVDVPEDTLEDAPVDSEEEPEGVCDEEITEPQVLYLSADDSNSQASPIIARSLIRSGVLVPSWIVRTYEFTNYYDISYTPAPDGRVNVVTQMMAADEGEKYAMQIGAQSHHLDPADGRRLNITLVLDTSGSMGGSPIMLERDVCRSIASSLRPGDIISMVTWSVDNAVVMDSHMASGPGDHFVISRCDSLTAGGGTNLHGGLTAGYGLATSNYDPEALNRVVLISDGQANVGETDETIIAMAAEDEEGEGIYLVGVGVGNGYNDTLMDAVTDKGKGAYVFIDSTEEAQKMFHTRFLSVMEIAVMDVQVELTLPPWLRIQKFYGEEISTSPKEVEPQHLAPDDAMVFHQDLVACTDPVLDDVIVAVARYTDPATRARLETSRTYTVAELLETQDAPQLVKGMAVVRYAEGLKEVADLVLGGEDEDAVALCIDVRDDLQEAYDLTADPDLFEIHQLINEYCNDVTTRPVTTWY